jgi:hypothetical protein
VTQGDESVWQRRRYRAKADRAALRAGGQRPTEEHIKATFYYELPGRRGWPPANNVGRLAASIGKWQESGLYPDNPLEWLVGWGNPNRR